MKQVDNDPKLRASLHRRDFVRGAASALVTAPLIGTGCGAGDEPELWDESSADSKRRLVTDVAFDPGAVAEDRALFPNANLAGEMKPTSMFLAGYFADRAPKVLRVWRPGGGPGRVGLVDERVVVPPGSGYVQAEVTGLQPGTWYEYAYFDGDPGSFRARSLIAKARTAPAARTLEPISVAISACNGGFFNPGSPRTVPFRYPALEATAEEYYDLFIHLGDQAYMDLVFAAGGATSTYLEGWKAYLGSEGMRRCYARSGMYATWDDHEITDNSAVKPWSNRARDIERIRNGKRAYFQAMPIVPGPDLRLWRSFRWGRTCEFIILDSRYEREPPSTSEYLSRAQMDFLKRRLLTSPCHFKVVANSVPITDMPGTLDWFGRNDRWEGYRDQRNEVINHISRNDIGNVWFITGDQHVNFVSRLNPSGNDLGSRTREIGVTGGNRAFNTPRGSQFLYGQRDARACILTFDPFKNVVNTRFVNPSTRGTDFEANLTAA